MILSGTTVIDGDTRGPKMIDGQSPETSPTKYSSTTVETKSPTSHCSPEEIAIKKRLAIERAERKRQEAATARGRLQLQQYGLIVCTQMEATSHMTFIENLPARVYEPASNISDEQLHALDAVKSGRNVFLSGPAGVGKSFILKEICRYLQSVKRHFFVTAPTGCASVNIQGQTLQSWAHIYKGEDGWLHYIEEAENKSNSNWLKAKVLILDEISMVSASLLEKLDQIARGIRQDSRPFGGIQVIFSGDFFQLAPIDKTTNCWKCSNESLVACPAPEDAYQPPLYDTPLWQRCSDSACGFVHNRNAIYCFESNTWKDLNFVSVMLTKVFRQSDSQFIECLNRLRYGACNKEDEVLLRSCMRPLQRVCSQGDPALFAAQDIKPTNLLATRNSVRTVNEAELRKLHGHEIHTFRSRDEVIGLGSDRNLKKLKDCQAQATIELTIGCQVMLLFNAETGLVNGSRGVIVDFVDSETYMQDARETEAKKQKNISSSIDEWKSSNYNRDKKQRVMLPHVLFSSKQGTRSLVILPHSWDVTVDSRSSVRRTQIPLSLAWAMTIHKSQGLSLDRALIDMGGCWGAGQAYVALSRCRSLEGLQIQTFTPSVIKADPKCVRFYESLAGKTSKTKFMEEYDRSNHYQHLLKDALSSFFDHSELSPGQEMRDKQIFLETVASLYDDCLASHKSRKAYSLLPERPSVSNSRSRVACTPSAAAENRTISAHSNASVVAEVMRSTDDGAKLETMDFNTVPVHVTMPENDHEAWFDRQSRLSSQLSVSDLRLSSQPGQASAKRPASTVKTEDPIQHKRHRSPKRYCSNRQEDMIDLTRD